MNKSRRPISIALVVIIIVLGIVLRNNRSRHKDRQDPRQEQTDHRRPGQDRPQPAGPGNDPERRNPQPTKPPSDEANREGGFDRRHGDGKLIYTKHARCRMACRHIDESEVQEILQSGTINDRKSEPAARPDPKYALEGRTHDGQQVRIIFAPASRGMVVITVIDLGTEWTCDCR